MTGHDRVREITGLENQVADLKMQLQKTEAQLSTANVEKAQLLDLLSAEKEEKRALMLPVLEQKPKTLNWLLRNPFGAR